MRQLVVESGDSFGNLIVVSECDTDGKRKFLCRCKCGVEVIVRLDHLRSGHTASCGGCGIEYRGRRMSIKDWAKSANIKESTLRARLKIMDIGEALERK